MVTALGRAVKEQGHLVEVILPRYDFFLHSPILQVGRRQRRRVGAARDPVQLLLGGLPGLSGCMTARFALKCAMTSCNPRVT